MYEREDLLFGGTKSFPNIVSMQESPFSDILSQSGIGVAPPVAIIKLVTIP